MVYFLWNNVSSIFHSVHSNYFVGSLILSKTVRLFFRAYIQYCGWTILLFKSEKMENSTKKQKNFLSYIFVDLKRTHFFPKAIINSIVHTLLLLSSKCICICASIECIECSWSYCHTIFHNASVFNSFFVSIVLSIYL